MFDRERQRRSVLIVGAGPEASLVATVFGASKYPNRESTVVLDSALVWVDSLTALDGQIQSRIWNKIILGESQSPEDIEGFSLQYLSVSSTRDELERYFGRVSIDSITDEVLENSRPKGVLWRSAEVLLTVVLLLPALFLVATFWLAFRICGVQQVFQRIPFVGQGEREVRVIVLAPVVPSVAYSARTFVAQSLARQVKRLHLAHTLGLLNVVRGDLVLVGPALISMIEYQAHRKEWPAIRLRTAVRPGLASLARVRLGRAHAQYDRKRALEYDLYYIKHRSPVLDLRILLRAMYMIGRDILITILTAMRSLWHVAVIGVIDKVNNLRKSPARLTAPSMPIGLLPKLAPTLVVGAGSGGHQLIRSLQENTDFGLWPVAVVDDDLRKVGTRVHSVPVLGTTDSLAALVVRESIEEIIIAAPSASDIERERITQLAQATGKPVHTIPSLPALLSGVASTELVNVKPSDLLGRPVVEIDPAGAKSLLQGKRVLITGAAGSIGSEVVIQALRGEPATIYGLDLNESDLYDLQQLLKRKNSATEFIPIVGSLTDKELVRSVVKRFRPSVVFHAGAYKHVPLMESYPREALNTNIIGTWNIVSASAEFRVDRFVMVSTDKAVRPSSVMGASKRIAELIVRSVGNDTGLSTCSVRFGNVLGSRGSVIPLFNRQIENGGPVTVTDERMTRYFMTIPEAAGLIIEAGAIGDRGVVYMLDMDEPVRIVDVAERLIRLKGLRPGVDIDIEFTGLRPGEKLFEDLALDFEEAHPTRHPKIRVLHESVSGQEFSAKSTVEQLQSRLDSGSTEELREEIMMVVQTADEERIVKLPSSPETTTPLDALAR